MFGPNTVNEHSVKNSFEHFWGTFHYKVKQYKHSNKSSCKKLWDSTINISSKIKAFENINDNIKLSAYEYLQQFLRFKN